ncbi:alpha-ketoglutarate-dependent dioxygenase AlkB [Frankia sp. AiPs1]|uniref:alpha-ketoglutarate-dependent dioxygenase AlkB n=1 Tax=Frankia sp. AiPs1 TaxID=573493 RepID=UPI002043567F|nr:alpha-ketoglutarate-dependent dioxygenase AlkB [Frankia sp. AiPs1]MCM3925620.1 alpha-ketoglutarate-dependent dioxygenase AlkB [Frankia sp. AiPs1]
MATHHATRASCGPIQIGLFETGPTEVDEGFGTARRIALDEHSWVEHVPGWLAGSDGLFSLLRDDAGWQQRSRWMYTREVAEPRLTAEYPDLDAAPEPLRGIAHALSVHYGVPYDSLWLNLYRDHRDGTSWHRDHLSCKRAECIVPVLSLGATRRFLVRPRDGGRSVVVAPAAGDLVVMGGRCQLDWRHAVPKQATPAGPRISVNFQSRLQAIASI